MAPSTLRSRPGSHLFWFPLSSDSSVRAWIFALVLALAVSLASRSGALGAPPSGASYVVEAGDTLLAVATKLGVPEGQQAAWLSAVVDLNALAGPDAIRAGQTLALPATSPDAATGTAQVSAPTTVPSTKTST